MGFTITQGLMLVLLTASTMVVSTANKGCQFGNRPYSGPYHPNNKQTSNRIIVETPTIGTSALTTLIGLSSMALST